jgi:hypothetical protein
VINTNCEGSQGIEILRLGVLLVTQIDSIKIFDSNNYKDYGNLPIRLLPSETREPNEILSIQKS